MKTEIFDSLEVGKDFVALNSLCLFYEAITCIQLHILFSSPRDSSFFLNLQIVKIVVCWNFIKHFIIRYPCRILLIWVQSRKSC